MKIGPRSVAALVLTALACAGLAAAAFAGVHKYDTELTIARDRTRFFHGEVKSGHRKCEGNRRVVLFKKRPGEDRKLDATQSPRSGADRGKWGMVLDKNPHRGDRNYAQVKRKSDNGFVCRADRSKTLTWPKESA
jgi:hypothetical protein